jgi:hypothetical protein
MSAVLSTFGGKATAGGLPLQISLWHRAFPCRRFPTGAPGKPQGSVRPAGRWVVAAGAGKPLYGLPWGRAQQGSVG